MSYIGIPPFGQTVRSVTSATATAGQTTFNIVGGYVVGYVDVFLNGVLLAQSDYTATNGTTVTLSSAAALNDEFQALSYQPISLADTYRRSEVDALIAGVGAAGAGGEKIIHLNETQIDNSYTIPSNYNGLSAGPITLATGATVTIPSGSTWVIL